MTLPQAVVKMQNNTAPRCVRLHSLLIPHMPVWLERVASLSIHSNARGQYAHAGPIRQSQIFDFGENKFGLRPGAKSFCALRARGRRGYRVVRRLVNATLPGGFMGKAPCLRLALVYPLANFAAMFP